MCSILFVRLLIVVWLGVSLLAEKESAWGDGLEGEGEGDSKEMVAAGKFSFVDCF